MIIILFLYFIEHFVRLQSLKKGFAALENDYNLATQNANANYSTPPTLSGKVHGNINKKRLDIQGSVNSGLAQELKRTQDELIKLRIEQENLTQIKNEMQRNEFNTKVNIL